LGLTIDNNLFSNSFEVGTGKYGVDP